MPNSARRDWATQTSLANPAAPPKRAWLAHPSTVVLTSFPPRECGIATFARDLIGAVEGATHLKGLARLAGPAPWVIAMNDGDQPYAYGPQVRMSICRDQRADYARAARYVNAASHTQVVSIQHEYGLYGGEYGDYLLDFIRLVERPVVLTMHTVLEDPDPALRQVTEALIQHSAMVVVLAQSARDILHAHYPNADLAKVVFIPHGTPAVRREPTRRYKRDLGLDGHTVLSTFGLLGPDKGIEHAIRALPEIVARHPDVVYLVLGQTHPGQRRQGGESYRAMLEALVDELDLRDHVRFYNRYLSMAELLRFLQATDVYILPYLNPKQIVSGTLAYAVACGKAVVSTPFVYAREMLGDGRGELARFRDPASITRAVSAYLDDPAHKAAVEARAYNFGLRMHWSSVGVTYCRLLRRVVEEHRAHLRAERSLARRKLALQARQALSIRPIAAGLGLAPGLRAATSRPRVAAPGVAQARLAAASPAAEPARS
ncbi:MAG TPA: glycosyltransferase family 4 protein [Ktedonobacterales bacterium]